MTFPLVQSNDDDKCFYCESKVGEPHKADCVVVTKLVRLRYSFVVDVRVPHSWDKSSILFHRNMSSWCADNGVYDVIDERRRANRKNGCICSRFTCSYIKTLDDTPKVRKRRK